MPILAPDRTPAYPAAGGARSMRTSEGAARGDRSPADRAERRPVAPVLGPWTASGGAGHRDRGGSERRERESVILRAHQGAQR
jgi:hypothetical protein